MMVHIDIYKADKVILRKKWQADVAIVDGKRCYSVEGSGQYGWCKARYTALF